MFIPEAEIVEVDVKLALQEFLGCSVAVLTWKLLERMENRILRRSILQSARTIYAP
jgi:hypothetical protein